MDKLRTWGLPDPNMVRQSEYRAIYEVLEDAVAWAEQDGDDPKAIVLSILNEFVALATSCIAELEAP